MYELLDQGLLTLSEQRAGVLGEAMRLHDRGRVSDDATVGACWDADRLQLQRFPYEFPTLRADLLSTPAARTADVQEQCRYWHFERISWQQLTESARQIRTENAAKGA
jgi:hypothetical protein